MISIVTKVFYTTEQSAFKNVEIMFMQNICRYENKLKETSKMNTQTASVASYQGK